MNLAAQNISLDGRLQDVSVTLDRGQITAICGPNGAGKSTLLQVLAGLLEPNSGSVLLDSCPLDILSPRERAKSLGYLPQTPEIAWDVPVRSLVALGRTPHGDSRVEPVDAALKALDLEALADRRAQSLSGGETARVLLARVLAGEPDWILADEPLAALDLAHQLNLIRHLRAVAESGVGVVLVVHDLALAMNYADRVIVLNEGRVAAEGAPQHALDAQVIERAWKVNARWIGEAGERALVTA
ncbi:ABC transporter ATP-binding protein [Erythrobacter sp. W53]|uniref:ABC transporter ATP-binding protein n=1 Tax=Erythrobacter sp. W53 TaxID=3425947 RepID=UPI003D767735